MSRSAAHWEHQARPEFRPRKIVKEVVSMVIVVCFAMGFCSPSSGVTKNERSLPKNGVKSPWKRAGIFLEFLGVS